jgi:hypothetical protein
VDKAYAKRGILLPDQQLNIVFYTGAFLFPGYSYTNENNIYVHGSSGIFNLKNT